MTTSDRCCAVGGLVLAAPSISYAPCLVVCCLLRKLNLTVGLLATGAKPAIHAYAYAVSAVRWLPQL